MDVFAEGLAILRRFIADQGVVDHRGVLAIEKEFRLPVGPFEVLGFIDRVDWIDDETVEVIDYKTNHQLFARDEVDTSLQMSLYEVAVRRLWPWAKKVKLTFWMLRHGAGVLAHQYFGHADGALLVLYAWLRLEAGLSSDAAFEEAVKRATGVRRADVRDLLPTHAVA